MIYIDADHLSDGLYNVKNGEIYKYKAKGGTVRAYKLADRPQGEWIAVSAFDAFGGDEDAWLANGNPIAFHYCSVCKNSAYIGEDGKEILSDFCPNCGARMKGADDEIDRC